LPADIDPLRVEPHTAGAILLTGATGFLGVHLLQQLLATSARRIVCPVRAVNDARARQRIFASGDVTVWRRAG
jgi:nonribosomal peptide synthetase MxcG